MKRKLSSNLGISPAVGVILLIGLSVATATLAGIVLLDIGDRNLNNSVNAGVEISETPDGVEVSWNNQGNAEEVKVQVNGETVSTLGTVNDNITLGVDKGETVSAVGVSEDSEQVIDETTTDDDTNSNGGSEYTIKDQEIAGQTVTGTVTLNPPIQGASVKIIDSEGNVVSSTTTDSQGKFSTVGTPGDEIKVVVDGDISYDGRDVYASKTKTLKSNSDVTIDFKQSKLVDFGTNKSAIINGSIATTQEIQAIPDDNSKQYTLISDINASELTNFEPITNFSGTLNGNNHTISSLSITTNSDEDNIGLFANIEDGTVKNIKFDSATVETEGKNVGVLAGIIEGTTSIENVTVSNSTVKGTYSGGIIGRMENSSSVTRSSSIDVRLKENRAGGLIGDLDNGSVTESYSLRTEFDTSYRTGLLVGESFQGSISNSYTRGVGGSETNETLVGLHSYTDVENVYNASGRLNIDEAYLTNGYYTGDSISVSSTRLDKYQMVEGTAEEKMDGFDFESVWKTPNGDRYPTLQNNPEPTQQSEVTINNTLYSCKNISYSTNRSGALEIDSAEKLQCVDSKSSNTDYVLTVDIDASNISDFEPIKKYDKFTGSLDGNGHTISNLSITINSDEDNIGLFANIEDGTMKNIKFDSATVETEGDYAGVLTGKIEGTTTIENVTVSNSTVKGTYSGGIIGRMENSSSLTRSSSIDVRLKESKAGGLIGDLDNGSVTESYSLRTEFDTSYRTGLLVGESGQGSISNSYTRGVGGSETNETFVGLHSYTDVENVYNASGRLNINEAYLTNGYYNSDISTGNGVGLTTSEMQGSNASSNMSGFNFTSVWNTRTNNYPELKNNPE